MASGRLVVIKDRHFRTIPILGYGSRNVLTLPRCGANLEFSPTSKKLVLPQMKALRFLRLLLLNFRT
jgi:hypothetical protein